MSVDGWMAFCAEAPMVGLDPMPAYAPNADAIQPGTAVDWTDVYSVYPKHHIAALEIQADHNAMLAAVEDGHLEDADEPDILFRVRVHPDGTLDVFDTDATAPFVSFTPDAVFDAFGMPYPL